MKRTYRVTVLIDVHGEAECDFRAAVARLRERGLWLEKTVCGETGSFGLKSRRGATVRRCKAKP